MMKELITHFPAQLKEAVALAGKAKLTLPVHPLHNILICGLGGSGIGGTIAKEIVHNQATLPIDVLKSYSIPAYVNAHTLVICSSYSGNTEETLEAYRQAKARGAHLVCITSGGQLLELAQKGDSHIVVPAGMPPRACLGYSLTQILHCLAFYGIAPVHTAHILEAATLLEHEQEAIKETARTLAARLHDRMPVIYSTSLHEGVAIRLRQQLNENAKILCWHHVLPEMNHNELVGWSQPYPGLAVILFRDAEEHPRNELRIEICKKIFERYAGDLIEIHPLGKNAVERKIYWIHLGDWLSFYLSEIRKVDAMDIKVIDNLKKALSEK
ncbi:MAG: bifunctional phosphoglucose/phosphomannose isomerase [Bacteroidia bacterium]|jgi:glucose/mannose-6-phosphate isomerase|nr:bifunctional phosphoglucose/phosphomannose isomerase [Bacteroidia bacterium]